MSDERPDGFYWVKSELGSWSIAEKNGGLWGVVAFLDDVSESEFTEIGERIERKVGDTYEQAVMRSAEYEMATMIPEICKRAATNNLA